jgi:hypothetical protein
MARGKAREPRKIDGEVYLLRIELDGKSVIKIGTTNRCALKRALELSEAIHGVYKFLPKIEILRNDRTHNNYVVEAALLERLKEHRYYPAFEFDGCSELVECDLTIVELAYVECMNADYPAQVRNLIEI